MCPLIKSFSGRIMKMEINMRCGTWMREDDEKMYNYLTSCEVWPTVDEVVKATGVRERRVRFSMDMILRQMTYVRALREFLSHDDPR